MKHDRSYLNMHNSPLGILQVLIQRVRVGPDIWHFPAISQEMPSCWPKEHKNILWEARGWTWPRVCLILFIEIKYKLWSLLSEWRWLSSPRQANHCVLNCVPKNSYVEVLRYLSTSGSRCNQLRQLLARSKWSRVSTSLTGVLIERRNWTWDRPAGSEHEDGGPERQWCRKPRDAQGCQQAASS